MRHSEQLSITISSQFLEELTEEIAVKVAARLKAEMHQVTSAKSVPSVFEEEKFRPTFLRLGEVAERIGFCRSTIYNKMNEGKFPQSVKLGERSVAWRLADIEVWECNPAGYSSQVLPNA
jgi:prophage regulatory protein